VEKGFRTLSLTLYGTPQDPRYAAVMVKRPVVIVTKQFGPLNQAGIQQAFDDMAKQGWGPYILTTTGPVNPAVFAGVFTPVNGIPLTRLNLTNQQFAEENVLISPGWWMPKPPGQSMRQLMPVSTPWCAQSRARTAAGTAGYRPRHGIRSSSSTTWLRARSRRRAPFA